MLKLMLLMCEAQQTQTDKTVMHQWGCSVGTRHYLTTQPSVVKHAHTQCKVPFQMRLQESHLGNWVPTTFLTYCSGQNGSPSNLQHTQTHPFSQMPCLTAFLGVVQWSSAGKCCVLFWQCCFSALLLWASLPTPCLPWDTPLKWARFSLGRWMKPECTMMQLETICSQPWDLQMCTHMLLQSTEQAIVCVLWGWSWEWEQLNKHRGRSNYSICQSSA